MGAAPVPDRDARRACDLRSKRAAARAIRHGSGDALASRGRCPLHPARRGGDRRRYDRRRCRLAAQLALRAGGGIDRRPRLRHASARLHRPRPQALSPGASARQARSDNRRLDLRLGAAHEDRRRQLGDAEVPLSEAASFTRSRSSTRRRRRAAHHHRPRGAGLSLLRRRSGDRLRLDRSATSPSASAR